MFAVNFMRADRAVSRGYFITGKMHLTDEAECGGHAVAICGQAGTVAEYSPDVNGEWFTAIHPTFTCSRCRKRS